MSEAENVLKQTQKLLKVTYWLTPVNLVVERDQFFKSKAYNPIFIYPAIPVDKLQDLRMRLVRVRTKLLDDDGSNKILLNRLYEKILYLNLLLARESEMFTSASKALYKCSYDNAYNG